MNLAGGTIVEVDRQKRDQKRMTNCPGWVRNRGRYRVAGGQAAARCAKLRVDRRLFLAPEAVIFGVVFTGPYILLIISGPVIYLIWLVLPFLA